MLIYHPAYDAYHCVFRTLIITSTLKSVEISKLRILDFFFVFPAEIRKVALPRNLADVKKSATAWFNEYHGPLNMHHTFKDMEQIQISAYRSLVASKILDSENFNIGIISRTELPLPEDLNSVIKQASLRDKEVISAIIEKINMIPLQGPKGLKCRTGLLEYRYDIS